MLENQRIHFLRKMSVWFKIEKFCEKNILITKNYI